MAKSVVIIGKGPSVLKSTKEFIDSFDEVAICNFPPIDGYEKYIGERATYHFLNAHDPNPYSRKRLNSLGLKFILNTHYAQHPGSDNIFPEHEVRYAPAYGETRIPQFKEEFGFDPSCGTIALDYFVRKKDITEIALVGFNFFKVSEKGYYYSPEEVQPSLKYLYSDSGTTPFTTDGTRIQENPHDSGKSEQFVYDMEKQYDKKILLVN
jgi:hypothetical protein|tara:strand:+ start:219 stop:845 length:627 start_codon:yes stop_codon:yes gene_type:complete